MPPVVYLDAAGYQVRSRIVPERVETDESGVESCVVDTARIDAALADASALCRAMLPDDLLDADGEPLAAADLSPRLADVLPRIVWQLAECALSDGALGSEDAIEARRAGAMRTLTDLRRSPDRPAVRAAIVEGASQWIPGETPSGSS